MISFDLSDDQIKKLRQWDDQHRCGYKQNSGAIVGRLTYCFSPTGLGDICIVKCSCGEEIDLTEYEKW